jgi:hypothetical protein
MADILIDVQLECMYCQRLIWVPQSEPPPFAYSMPVHQARGFQCPGSGAEAVICDTRGHQQEGLRPQRGL